MDDYAQPRCCSREMTVIGLERPSVSLRLLSCPACGRHSWRSSGRDIDRSEVLQALSAERRPAPARSGLPRTLASAAADGLAGISEQDRRVDLQRLLAGFSAHGTSS